MIPTSDISTETKNGLRSVVGKKVTILGAARSGVAVAELLKSRGAVLFVSDVAPEEKLVEQVQRLRSMGIEFETGTHTSRVFEADVIVLSPGVPTQSPTVQEAERRGIRIVSELEAA